VIDHVGAEAYADPVAAEVDRWREHGSLGSLWMSGHLGGTRW